MFRRLRVQRVAWQLHYTDDCIAAIAFGAELSSSQAFAKIFRRYMGESFAATRVTRCSRRVLRKKLLKNKYRLFHLHITDLFRYLQICQRR
ncbi:hypothetical protein N5483_001977 [Salmonella enterica subsp. enterica serovar Chester]|jgi:AraC family transcriptional regulator|nr:hypothetical protein [Salmonella enterica subsp. enterica serovar Chester]ELN8034330.1 hypothetical protein [Salmonella enterica]